MRFPITIGNASGRRFLRAFVPVTVLGALASDTCPLPDEAK